MGKYESEKEGFKRGFKKSKLVETETVLCYLGVNTLGMNCVEISRQLGISPSTVSKLAYRGRGIKEEIIEIA